MRAGPEPAWKTVRRGGCTADSSTIDTVAVEVGERGVSRQSRTHYAGRWAVVFTSKYVSSHRRMVAEREMAALASAEPEWTRVFLSGVLSNLVQSLPSKDPWTMLGGRVVGGGVDLVTPGPLGFVPETTGAVGPDGPFGTLNDFFDLLVAPTLDSDAALDKYAVQAADPLSPESAAMLAFASRGWRTCVHAALALEQVSGLATWDFAPDAIRWVSHRRTIYEGEDDLYPALSFSWWDQRASRLLADMSRTDFDEEIAEEIDSNRIDEAVWEVFQAD